VLFIKLIKLFQKKPSKEIETKFLVVTTTALGDTIWATPAIRLLKQKHPEASIVVLTSIQGMQVLANNPHIEQILVLKRPLYVSLMKAYKGLKTSFFKKILILHTSQRAILPFCYLMHSEEIVGSVGINKGLDKLITKKISNNYEHEILRRLRICDIDPTNKNLDMELFPSHTDKAQAANFIKKNKLTHRPLIGIHPGSKDMFKQWPVENFMHLVEALSKQVDCHIVITCSTDEQPMASKVAGSIGFVLNEKFNITSLASLIEKFDLFITNDTGPMHIAFACGTKTIALFTPTDASLCGPLMIKHAVVIQKEKTCSPCIRKKCNNPFCMLQITPSEVAIKALEILKGIPQ
jgi:ADP-heptose:LPS heptosyltransferase